jgi:hypothetical protein
MVQHQRSEREEYKRLDWARRILELPEDVSFADIQEAYHERSRRWHPDQHEALQEDDCNRHMQEVNEAYRILREYVLLCPVSLRREDLRGPLNANEWWWDRFGTVFGQRHDDGG